MSSNLPELFKTKLIDDLDVFRKNPTIQSAIGKTPVYMAKNHMDEVMLIALVVTVVSDEMESFSVKQRMTEKMIYTFARQFIQNRTHDSIHDLVAMFDMAQSGQLSKHYGSIDVLKLNEWFNEYLEHKSYALENANAEMRQEMWSDGLSDEDIKRLGADFKEVNKIAHTNQPTTFEKWAENFKDEFPKMDKKKQQEWLVQIKDLSVTSMNYSELYTWCLDNKI